MAPAQEADGLLTVQVLHTGLKIDVQVLRGIVVLHPERHLVVHAADRIDDGRDAVKVYDNILIRLKAHQALDLFFRLLDVAALAAGVHAVGCVDLLARAGRGVVAHGVARDVHNVDGLFLGVHRRDHQRIRSCSILIDRADDEREHIVDARARVEQTAHIDLVAVLCILDGRVVGLRRTHENPCRCRRTRDQHQHDCRNDGDALFLLAGCELFFHFFRLSAFFTGWFWRRHRLVCTLRSGCGLPGTGWSFCLLVLAGTAGMAAVSSE